MNDVIIEYFTDPIIYTPIVISLLFIPILYKIYCLVYFNSDKFENIKNSIELYVENCNKLNLYIQELKDTKCINNQIKNFSSLTDNSKHTYKRKHWDKLSSNEFTYNCTSTVCKNSSLQPFKYLCKYFNISITEETLSNFEKMLNNFESVKQGTDLLVDERDTIISNIEKYVPTLIYIFSKKKLQNKLGFLDIEISDLHYPTYIFQYVSSGGNSSYKNEIKLDINTLNDFINYLNSTIKFKKSVAGQRSLMTSNLREHIKIRDNYTCKCCSVSIYNEPHLLLEIDHIIPLSKGGITTENNLQTLCWKCNRTKGSRII